MNKNLNNSSARCKHTMVLHKGKFVRKTPSMTFRKRVRARRKLLPSVITTKNVNSLRENVDKNISWKWWFRRRVWRRRYIEKAIHEGILYGAAMCVTRYKWNYDPIEKARHLDILKQRITGHAPWLNPEAIGYRAVIGAEKFNDKWYIN